MRRKQVPTAVIRIYNEDYDYIQQFTEDLGISVAELIHQNVKQIGIPIDPVLDLTTRWGNEPHLGNLEDKDKPLAKMLILYVALMCCRPKSLVNPSLTEDIIRQIKAYHAGLRLE